MGIIFTLLLSLSLYGNEKPPSTDELVDFDSLKKVLETDMLGEEVRKVIRKKKVDKKKKLKEERSKFNVPGEDEFWSFFSEYWLVRMATVVKWDFRKPEYGLADSFEKYLERMGVFEKKFKILLVNTPDITHFALPSNGDEYIFLLSVPFIRTLDLTKLEISTLLYEDLLRIKAGYFKKFVMVKGINKFVDSNFHKKKFNKKMLTEISKKYDDFIFSKGYNFQQQFEVTKQMETILKSDMKLWNTYYNVIRKVDDLVKTNILYQKYNRIYPSPEMQLNWMRPKSEVL